MSKTAVGLFPDSKAADLVVHDLKASGFPPDAVRVMGEPLDIASKGVLSIPHTDFEVRLMRDLKAIEATEPEAEAYVQRVRGGGVVVFATGSGEKADAATALMNRHNAIDMEEISTSKVRLPDTNSDHITFEGDDSLQAGRIGSSGGRARIFVW